MMKKLLNVLLICSLLTTTTVFAKEKKAEKFKKNGVIQIIKPEKQKVSKNRELKNILHTIKFVKNLLKKPKECMKLSFL